MAHDTGIAQRTVLIESDSLEQTAAARENAAHQKALTTLSDGAERDLRITDGIN